MPSRIYSFADLISPLLTWDPGGIRIARGILIVIAVTLAGYVGYGLFTHFRIPGIPDLVVFSAGVAGHSLLFTAPASRKTEAIDIFVLGFIAQGLFVATILLSSLNAAFGDLPFHVLWILIIGLAFFLRRYGKRFELIGIFMALIWLFVTVVLPGIATAFWLPAAGVIGTVCALIVRSGPWRPSALSAFRTLERRYGNQLSAAIGALEIPDMSKTARTRIVALRLTRNELIQVTAAVRLEQPDLDKPDMGERFDALLTVAFRQILALEVAAEVIGKLPEAIVAKLKSEDAFHTVITTLQAAAIAGRSVANLEALDKAVDEVRTGLLGLKGATRYERFHMLRLLFSLRRLAVLMRLGEGVPAPSDEASRLPSKARESAAPFPYWKLSVQGLVAASITTVLARVFQLDHAYWATMTVVIVLSGELGSTSKRIFDRAVGTALGVSAALLAQWFIDDFPVLQFSLICLCLAFLFVILERNYLIAAGLIGFSVVTTLHLFEGVTPAEMAARIYETFIGAGVALLTAWLVFPIRSDNKIEAIFRNFLADCRALLGKEGPSGQVALVRLQKLHQDATSFAQSLQFFQNERLLFVSGSFDAREFTARTDVLARYCSAFLQARSVVRKVPLNSEQQQMVDALMDDLQFAFDASLDGTALPDLSDTGRLWSEQLPLETETDLELAADMVSLLYFGRKIVSSLAGMQRSTAWRSIVGPDTPHPLETEDVTQPRVGLN
ncbi:MAG: FUSC family protein [Stappiaceae bacterium]